MGKIMASNVFTKNEILKELANRGYFIDSYTLDTFFQKWKIEAIFEDEQGSEFFDKNALDLVLSNLFSQKNEETSKEEKAEEAEEVEVKAQEIEKTEEIKEEKPSETQTIDDKETFDALKNISLSDGTPLINKVQDEAIQNIEPTTSIQEETINLEEVEPLKIEEEKPVSKGILETAMEGLAPAVSKEEEKPEENIQQEPIEVPSEPIQTQVEPIDDRLFEAQPDIVAPYNPQNDFPTDNADFDDISLISESLEAQERFKNYLVSELSKKNVDLAPKTNEFKLDISERTLSMIAKTMAKKIAKHVSMICSQDAKAAAKLEDIQAKNEKLEQRAKELEEQNKKLRLLLAESNKNLNSYKPSMFGLYKKVNPQ